MKVFIPIINFVTVGWDNGGLYVIWVLFLLFLLNFYCQRFYYWQSIIFGCFLLFKRCVIYIQWEPVLKTIKMIFSVKYFFLNRFVIWASFYSHMMVFTYHDHICWKSDQGGRAWDMAFLWMKGGKFWKLAQRFWFEMSLWRQKRIFNPEKFQFIYSK